MLPCICLYLDSETSAESFSFLLILEPVWVGLGWDSGWDVGSRAWDFPTEGTSLGPPLNSRAELENTTHQISTSPRSYDAPSSS
jgi:hypothetical protein